jgi:anti-sigma factor RsiW
MSCPELERLAAFADGALDATAGTEIERHLSACSSCRERVEEMSWLDVLGRSSVGAIQVSVERGPILLREAPNRKGLLRPMALASAAVGLILLSFAAWRVSDRFQNQRRASAPQPAAADTARADRNTNTETDAPTDGAAFSGSWDEAFERWVERYRRLRIPLVPMEDLANFNLGRTIPVEPAPAKRDGAG